MEERTSFMDAFSNKQSMMNRNSHHPAHTPDQCIERILSVQSHVVHGFVGNKCAAFILQTLCYDVDCINTVHFSNHTGYTSFAGSELKPREVIDVFNALEDNSLVQYRGVISGYLKSEHVGADLATIISKIGSTALYLCDPVMGDDDCLYVPECVIDVYRNKLVPLATIITPNFFEFKLLIGVNAKSELGMEEICARLKDLHKRGPNHIVITSMPSVKTEHLALIGSSNIPEAPIKQFKILIPNLRARFTGTGDCFAALLMHFSIVRNLDFEIATLAATMLLHLILKRTIDLEGACPDAYIKELYLIHCSELIRNFDVTQLIQQTTEHGIMLENL